jgi:hypothetical protein
VRDQSPGNFPRGSPADRATARVSWNKYTVMAKKQWRFPPVANTRVGVTAGLSPADNIGQVTNIHGQWHSERIRVPWNRVFSRQATTMVNVRENRFPAVQRFPIPIPCRRPTLEVAWAALGRLTERSVRHPTQDYRVPGANPNNREWCEVFQKRIDAVQRKGGNWDRRFFLGGKHGLEQMHSGDESTRGERMHRKCRLGFSLAITTRTAIPSCGQGPGTNAPGASNHGEDSGVGLQRIGLFRRMRK